MSQNNYVKEHDWIYTTFPKFVLWIYSAVALMLPYTPFFAYLPTSDSILYVNTLFMGGVIAANLETFKKKNVSIIDDLNWLFIAFGSALVVSVILLIVPTLGKTGSFLAFSAAVQMLIVLMELHARRFPVALFIWSGANLLLLFNRIEIPSNIFLAMVYPLTVMESMIRKVIQMK